MDAKWLILAWQQPARTECLLLCLLISLPGLLQGGLISQCDFQRIAVAAKARAGEQLGDALMRRYEFFHFILPQGMAQSCRWERWQKPLGCRHHHIHTLGVLLLQCCRRVQFCFVWTNNIKARVPKGTEACSTRIG